MSRGVLFNEGGNELIAVTGSCACATDDLLLRSPIRYAARLHRGALKSQARKAAELLHNCASRRDNFWTLLIGQTHFHTNNRYSTTWNRNFQLNTIVKRIYFIRNVTYDSNRFNFKLLKFFLDFSFHKKENVYFQSLENKILNLTIDIQCMLYIHEFIL